MCTWKRNRPAVVDSGRGRVLGRTEPTGLNVVKSAPELGRRGGSSHLGRRVTAQVAG